MNLEHLQKRLNQVRRRDQIFQSEAKEQSIIRDTHQAIMSAGYQPAVEPQSTQNHGWPNVYTRGTQRVAYRFVDSLYLHEPKVWNWTNSDLVITDNVAFDRPRFQEILAVPEFWHIFACEFSYQNRLPTADFNCFMNRISGDRSMIFYELIRRNLLDLGLVSFNCWLPGDGRHQVDHDYAEKNYEAIYQELGLNEYKQAHENGRSLIPFCNFDEDLGLAQSIIDSRISLVVETYVAHSHVTFSEKIFRALQLPRPWLLYSSPGALRVLRNHGFDVLDDMVDTDYDSIYDHGQRVLSILDQLTQFVGRQYTALELDRMCQAAQHNQRLLLDLEQAWPNKFQRMLDQIS